jgi:hypothetical protein
LKRVSAIFFIVVLTAAGCSLYSSLEDISRLKYKIDSVSDFYIAGVPVSEKTRLAEFSSAEVLKMSFAFMQGNLPAKFSLNLEVINPNYTSDRDEGVTVTVKSFPWELFIDNQEMITGNISMPLVIPANIQRKILPVKIEMNLAELFQDRRMNELTELLLNFSGDSNSTSRIELYAQPVLDTSLGELTYPEKLKIVDYTYR